MAGLSSGPEVCCILPFREKFQFVERALGCFYSQDYENKRVYTVDSSPDGFGYHSLTLRPGTGDTSCWDAQLHGRTVGAIRNFIVDRIHCPIIAHFDYDDWSDPGRLTQQVQLMELTGRRVVGYYDMPIHDLVKDRVYWYDSHMRNYSLGTALMYRRELWEKIPFPDITPEDTTWQRQIGQENIAAISSLRNGKPMMVQTIHGSNGAAHSSAARFDPASPELERIVRKIVHG